jgi:FKBP-type peptidyl-prolyl cis-trans isomerase (trigger factor)
LEARRQSVQELTRLDAAYQALLQEQQADEQQMRDQVEQLRGQAGEIATHNLKRKFLLDKIAEAEKIEGVKLVKALAF